MNHKTAICWTCMEHDVKYCTILEILNKNYIVENDTFKCIKIPTPVVQCICSMCGGNGIHDKNAIFTNDWVSYAVSEFVLQNQTYFLRKYYEQKNI